MAALLHAAGHQVLLCGHTPRDHIEVRPDGEDADRGAGARCSPTPRTSTAPSTWCFWRSRTPRTRAHRGWLGRLCDDRTVVCALQNGVEQVERVGPLCPSSEVVPCGRVVLRRTAPRRLDPAAHRCPAGAARDGRRAETRGTPARHRCGRRARPRLRHRGVAQAAGERAGRPDGADRTPLGHVPPRRRRRAGAPIPGRMPCRRAGRGRHLR